MLKKTSSLFFFACLTFFFLVPDTAAQNKNQKEIHSPLKSCRVDGVGEELLCGKFSVFENRRLGEGRRIALHVVVVPALESEGKKPPLFWLEGGPGLPATGSAGLFTRELGELRRNRDIVLVDQRGTGRSNGLYCRRLDGSAQYFLGDMYPVDYVRTCRRELGKQADLTKYTTPIAMDDLDDVRRWLGYEKIDLAGLSYGTRAALVYLRRHPETVRSMVLLGVATTGKKMPFYHARDGQQALDLLLADCLAEAACRRAFPEVKDDLRRVIARLRKKSARVRYVHPRTKTTHELEIRAAIFAEQLRKNLYSPLESRRLPLVIHRAAEGDFKPFLDMVIPADISFPESDWDGIYLSITCAEDVPFIDVAEGMRISDKTVFGSYRIVQQKRACRYWPRGEISENYRRPVKADAPVLLISGGRDPVTPPADAEEVSRYLSASRHVVIPYHAHVPVGISNLDCLVNMIRNFLDEPDTKKVDPTCADKMLPAPFVTGK